MMHTAAGMTDPGGWGRFTVFGTTVFEADMRETVVAIVKVLESRLRGMPVRCLALIGGYGRGEGGVETLPNGAEHPHNNLDLLLVGDRTATPAAMARLKGELDTILHSLTERFGLGIDLGWTTETRLNSSPGLVMWYDMRHGHKTLWGDSTFIPALSRFTVENIPAWDARNLLVNRGTLLVINNVLRSRGELTESDRRTLIRHAVKAIIGYGDALLYFLGQYNWSYQEKLRRVRTQSGISPEFRELYAVAAAFRLQPQYDTWLARDPEALAETVRAALAPIHLKVESLRLRRPDLTWETYPEVAFAHALRDIQGPRSLAKRLYYLLRPHFTGATEGLHVGARLGCRAGGPREMLAVLFPMVAYHLADPRYLALTQGLLEARKSTDLALCHAYLRAWGIHGDINFGALLERLRLSLDGVTGATDARPAHPLLEGVVS